MESIGDRVKEIRTTLRLNQKSFSSELGISQSFLSAIESGNRDITGSVIKSLIVLFSVSTDWLLTGKGHQFLINSEEKKQGSNEGELQGTDSKAHKSVEFDEVMMALNKNSMYSGFGLMEYEVEYLLSCDESTLEKNIKSILYDIENHYKTLERLADIINDFDFEEFKKERYSDFKEYFKSLDSDIRFSKIYEKGSERVKRILYYFSLKEWSEDMISNNIYNSLSKFHYFYFLDKNYPRTGE